MFSNSSLKKPKKWISAIMALVFLFVSICPAEAREGNSGDLASWEMFSVGALMGALTVVSITGIGPIPAGGWTAVGASAAGNLMSLYMYYEHYQSSQKTMMKFEVFGVDVKISRQAFWAMVASCVVGSVAGAAGSTVASSSMAEGTKQVAKEGAIQSLIQLGKSAVQAIINLLKSVLGEFLARLLASLLVNLIKGFLKLVLSRLVEEIGIQVLGMKEIWAQTLQAVASLFASIASGLFNSAEEVEIITDPEDPNKILWVKREVDPKTGKPSAGSKPTVVARGTLNTDGTGEITTTDGKKYKLQLNPQNGKVYKLNNNPSPLVKVVVGVLGFISGAAIDWAVDKAFGKLYSLVTGKSLYITAYGQVMEKKDVKYQEAARQSFLSEETIDDGEKESEPSRLRKILSLFTGGIISEKPTEKKGKSIEKVVKDSPEIGNRLNRAKGLLDATGGVMLDPVSGKVIADMSFGDAMIAYSRNSQAYTSALQALVSAGMLEALDYQEYNGSDKKKAFRGQVKSLVASGTGKLVSGAATWAIDNWYYGNYNDGNWKQLAGLTGEEVWDTAREIAVTRWMRDWSLHPTLKGAVNLAAANAESHVLDLFRMDEDAGSAWGYVASIPEDFRNDFIIASFRALMPLPSHRVSGVNSFAAKKYYDEYQEDWTKRMEFASLGMGAMNITANALGRKLNEVAGERSSNSFSNVLLMAMKGQHKTVRFQPGYQTVEQQVRLKENEKKNLEELLEYLVLIKEMEGLDENALSYENALVEYFETIKGSNQQKLADYILQRQGLKCSIADRQSLTPAQVAEQLLAGKNIVEGDIKALINQINQGQASALKYTAFIPVFGILAQTGVSPGTSPFRGGTIEIEKETKGGASFERYSTAGVPLLYKITRGVNKGTDVKGTAITSLDIYGRPVETAYYSGEKGQEVRQLKGDRYYGPQGDYVLSYDATNIKMPEWGSRAQKQVGVEESEIVGYEPLPDIIIPEIFEAFFDFNKVNITPKGLDEIKKKASEIIKYLTTVNPNATLVVAGYTDKVDDNEYNVQLGQRRAESLKAALVKEGVPEARIQTLSRGENFAFKPEKGTNNERQADRRAAFMYYKSAKNPETGKPIYSEPKPIMGDGDYQPQAFAPDITATLKSGSGEIRVDYAGTTRVMEDGTERPAGTVIIGIDDLTPEINRSFLNAIPELEKNENKTNYYATKPISIAAPAKADPPR